VFRAVNWTPNEIIDDPKMDVIVANADYLYVNTPRAIYTLPGGISRDEGVKIASGRVMIPKNMKSDTATVEVRFGNFFSSRCEPIITTGVITKGQVRTFCVINGLGGKLQPDSRGFNVSVNIGAEAKKNDKILRSFYVAWQAIGY
jgi:hypothetical protein